MGLTTAEKSSICKKRKTQIKALERIHAYVMSFDSSAYDISELEARLKKLSDIKEAFEKLQIQLEDEAENSDEDEIRAAFEESMFTVQAKIIRKANALTTAATETHVRLPMIELPKYDGDIKEWPNFKDLFCTLVHNSKTISTIQKFMFLKSSLNGHALSMIQSIPVVGSNYQSAWQSLIDRYDNLQILVSSHLKMICQEPIIKKGCKDELRKLITELNQNVRALHELGVPVIHWDAIIIYLTNRRLPQDLREKWCRTATNQDLKQGKWPTFKQFIEFLETECYALESAKIDQRIVGQVKPQMRSNSHVATTSNNSYNKCMSGHFTQNILLSTISKNDCQG